MSRHAINRLADELGVSHETAQLIYETTGGPAEFMAAIAAYANGEGFTLID